MHHITLNIVDASYFIEANTATTCRTQRPTVYWPLDKYTVILMISPPAISWTELAQTLSLLDYTTTPLRQIQWGCSHVLF